MNIRRIGYWLRDSLFHGGSVRKHFADVERILNGNESAQRTIDGYREAIFQYAMQQAPFYRATGATRFEELPVIDKLVIKSQYNQFLSPEYLNQKVRKMSTSGSTGTPFSIIQDMNKRWRGVADILAFHPDGFRIRDHIVMFRGITPMTQLSAWRQWELNITLLDASDLSDARLDTLREDFQQFREKTMLYGYASVYERLSRYMLAKGDEAKVFSNVCAVVTVSESLSPSARDILRRIFKVPILSRYANQEMGVLGQQIDREDFYVLNTASYHFEIFDMNQDVPVADGTLGRIVITDLFNHAMPLLRYDTGDVGVMETKIVDGKPRRVLTTLEGRRSDLLCNTRGEFVSHYAFINFFWAFPEIVQYQVIQKTQTSYEVHLNVKSKFLREEEVVVFFKHLLGKNVGVKFIYVDEIPVLASGKRKICVNEWKKLT